MATEREDLLKIVLEIALKSAENFDKTGDTYQASNALKGIQMLFEVRGWDKESGDKSLTSPKLLEELKLLNDQLAGRKRKRALKPRGKPFTGRDDPRLSPKPPTPEEEIPFTDPGDDLTIPPNTSEG